MRAFPWAHEIEIAEILRQLDRLIDHALVFLGIAQLDKAGERKVLALRMASKAVIGEDAAQIRVAGEYHAVHVEHFALEPAGDRPEACNRWNRRRLIGAELDADTVILGHREQVIDHLEPLWPLRIVNARNFHQLLVLRAIPQPFHHAHDAVARDDKGNLVRGLDQREQIRADERAQAICDAVRVNNSGGGMHAAHLSIVPTRRILRWSCIMP